MGRARSIRSRRPASFSERNDEARGAHVATSVGMKPDPRTDYVARNSIEQLLSEAELARVSNVESAGMLAVGDEYVDLAHLDRGVCTAPPNTTPTGHMLERNAVQQATWTKIVAVLAGK